jgi:hypothetical protein
MNASRNLSLLITHHWKLGRGNSSAWRTYYEEKCPSFEGCNILRLNYYIYIFTIIFLPVINTKQHIVCFFVFWVIKRQLLSCTLKIQTKNNMFCELRLRWPDTNFKCILKLIYILEHTVFLRNRKRRCYTMQFVLQFCCDTRSTSLAIFLNDWMTY